MLIGGTADSAPNDITNSTISGNRSKIGGGIAFYNPITISNSTIAFNTSQQLGGGLGPITLRNTIVSNNFSDFAAKNCSRDDFAGSEGNNLERGTSCGLTEPTDKNADPDLGPLENNGGPPTPTPFSLEARRSTREVTPTRSPTSAGSPVPRVSPTTSGPSRRDSRSRWCCAPRGQRYAVRRHERQGSPGRQG